MYDLPLLDMRTSSNTPPSSCGTSSPLPSVAQSSEPSDEEVEIHDQAPPKDQEDELPIVRLHIKVSSKDKKKPKFGKIFKGDMIPERYYYKSLRDNPTGKNERISLLGTPTSTRRIGLPMTGRQMSGRRKQAKYMRKYEELNQADPNTLINKNDLFYQVVGVNKGRVYGLGSYGDSSYGLQELAPLNIQRFVKMT
ncbi:hypothetical protein Scep_007436 [Stephania cephalantha]|uniref:Uncharacterized protein n=1 Tax=Stephania cephalantha TaxID=152367 RepID=A0AAP0KBK8_9MAGN